MLPINVDFARRSAGLVCIVNNWRSGVSAGTANWANRRRSPVVERRCAGGEVIHATGIVPVRRVVIEHTEVRAAHNLQIVGEAGMGDGKVIGRGIGGFGILVGEWRV